MIVSILNWVRKRRYSFMVLSAYLAEIYAIFYAITTGQWYLLLITVALAAFYSMAFSIYCHRYLAHNSFGLHSWQETILAVMSFLGGQGDSIGWVKIHLLHHAYPDTDRDPNSPHGKFNWWQILLTLNAFLESPDEGYKRCRPERIPELNDNAVAKFLRNHYYKLWILIVATTWALTDISFVSLFLLGPVAVVTHQAGLVSSLGHWHGYRNFDTPDKSRNSWIVNMLTFGEGFQNNHHKDASSAVHAFRPGEFDLLGWLIVRLFKDVQVYQPK